MLEWQMDAGIDVTNPYGFLDPATIETVNNALVYALPVVVLLCIIPLVSRLRRSRGTERQQLKWLGFGVFVAATGLILGSVFAKDLGDNLGDVLISPLVAVPVSIAVAILRHKLWDIDRILNRTLVYGLLTAVLAGLYAVGVLVIGHALSSTGRANSLVVAATTLGVAAAFQPLRRRIQRVVDRRFNRRRYDADRTVDAFAGRLRQQVDLGALHDDLLGVVQQTVEPARASLWLRR
jgi:hypothetical protein